MVASVMSVGVVGGKMMVVVVVVNAKKCSC